ncbi:hypothetical protein CQA53_10270 [Helicobacter didelphidarum]|uniref:Uncharacterized protein n=1 Tax=Helicobacter didelphidarum TaxID=2040648 RepID=A0A3D8I8R0_9HELI|nr:hypothetical protein [Helicobacter didelphidarum]RDU61356.1 hypothetical protein CQA53_10270 [Helicobacter didelphidarum]
MAQVNILYLMTPQRVQELKETRERIEEYMGKKIIPIFRYIDSITIDIRFFFAQSDLISLTDILTLKDYQYNAFGVPIPRRIILETLEFNKNQSDSFSVLVKQYPFIQLAFSQWLTIKLYEKHKILNKKENLSYKDFMTEYFSFTYNSKQRNIYEAIEIMRGEEINNMNEEFASPISTLYASSGLTLFDFIYDLIPNAIRTNFLNTKEKLTSYLPLKQDRFEYQDNIFSDIRTLSFKIYGCKDNGYDGSCEMKCVGRDDDGCILYESIPKKLDTSLPKENYILNALSLKDYPIDSKELVVAKAKMNNLGIGYDELWEIMNNTKPEMMSKNELEKLIPEKFYNPTYPGEPFEIPDEKWINYNKALLQNLTKEIHNNYLVNYRIFEEIRVRERKGDEPDIEELTRSDFPRDGLELHEAGYTIYRFNQALTMAFLNAYDTKDSHATYNLK